MGLSHQKGTTSRAEQALSLTPTISDAISSKYTLVLAPQGDICLVLTNFNQVECHSWIWDVVQTFGGQKVAWNGKDELPTQLNVIVSGLELHKCSSIFQRKSCIRSDDGWHREYHLSDHDDSAEALLILLIWMFSDGSKVPGRLCHRLLGDICKVIHKYNLHRKVQPLTAWWCPIRSIAAIPSRCDMRDIESSLCIGHVLHRSNVVERAIEDAILYGTGSFQFIDSPFPEELLCGIIMARDQITEDLSNRVSTVVRGYDNLEWPICQHGGFQCGSTAYSILIESLHRSRNFGGAHYPTEVLEGCSLVDAVFDLKGIDLPGGRCWSKDNGRWEDCESVQDMDRAIRSIVTCFSEEKNQAIEDLMLDWVFY